MTESHPTRVRGLKQFLYIFFIIFFYVTPHAGAWIETIQARRLMSKYGVAPHAGAWIETCTLTKVP